MRYALALTAVVGLGTLGLVGLATGQPSNATSAPKIDDRPNVIVIIADDLGYGDTGVYGSTLIKTPNIDALAASGVRFTSGYVTHPVCAPSRAALVTGRYQQRFGFEFNPVGRDAATGVALNEVTIAQLMKKAGYRTGMVGKWHLGQGRGYYPTDRGFDEYFGMASGGSTYIVDPQPGDEFHSTAETEMSTSTDRLAGRASAPAGQIGQRQRLLAARQRFPITRNGKIVDVPEYLTDAFTDEATRFIGRDSARPFFLYLAYTAPHTPLQATKRYADRYAHIADPAKRVYAAMVSALDDGVGRVVAQVKAKGLERRTLIVFLSDNGCAGYLGAACSNGPLSGSKATPLEGGIRVPFIMAMPGRIAGGRVDARTVSSLDVLPTALGLAAARAPSDRPYDGIDLMPRLTTSVATPARTLYWRAGAGHAVLRGHDKLVSLPLAPDGAKAGYVEREVDDTAATAPHVMLYDLSRDPGETRNRAAVDRRKAASLARSYDIWAKALAPPAWPSRRVVYIDHDGHILDVRN